MKGEASRVLRVAVMDDDASEAEAILGVITHVIATVGLPNVAVLPLPYRSADSCIEALRSAASAHEKPPFDILFADVFMPEQDHTVASIMGGAIRVARAVHEIWADVSPPVKVVAITSRRVEGALHSALARLEDARTAEWLVFRSKGTWSGASLLDHEARTNSATFVHAVYDYLLYCFWGTEKWGRLPVEEFAASEAPPAWFREPEMIHAFDEARRIGLDSDARVALVEFDVDDDLRMVAVAGVMHAFRASQRRSAGAEVGPLVELRLQVGPGGATVRDANQLLSSVKLDQSSDGTLVVYDVAGADADVAAKLRLKLEASTAAGRAPALIVLGTTSQKFLSRVLPEHLRPLLRICQGRCLSIATSDGAGPPGPSVTPRPDDALDASMVTIWFDRLAAARRYEVDDADRTALLARHERRPWTLQEIERVLARLRVDRFLQRFAKAVALEGTQALVPPAKQPAAPAERPAPPSLREAIEEALCELGATSAKASERQLTRQLHLHFAGRGLHFGEAAIRSSLRRRARGAGPVRKL